jgi:hypothetical protein
MLTNTVAYTDLLLGNVHETNNEILINKYTAPLLSNTFTNKRVLTATNPQATIDEELETVFSLRSLPSCYKQGNWLSVSQSEWVRVAESIRESSQWEFGDSGVVIVTGYSDL